MGVGGGGVGKKYLVIDDDNREHKEPKDVNRNAVATKSLNEHKDVFLNNKCLRYSVNRIQSKDHGIGTYEINKILLSCFHDKIYTQNNWYDQLALSYLYRKVFRQAYYFNCLSS